MKRIGMALLISLVLSTGLAQAAEKMKCVKPTHLPDVSTYYNPALGLNGDALKSSLHSLLAADSYVFDYACIWTILAESDEDPNNPENVIGIYSQRSIPKADRDHGQNDPDSWNREHVWAKSHGFPKATQYAYTDAHHLRPADRSLNTKRNNRDFADHPGRTEEECPDCRKGNDYSWYPGSAVAGDIARMMFYMATRYEGVEGDGGTPDLEIAELITGSKEQGPRLGVLCDLYRWHHEDPVSDWERRRNDRVFAWQANRNPFIDHPEWVDSIWGGQCP